MNEQAEKPPPISQRARIGLLAIFGSTLFQLSGNLMLSPLLILKLEKAGVSATVAGLFAAMTWLGIFLMTPFASTISHRIGRLNSLWIASVTPLVTTVGFLLTDNLAIWFFLRLVASMASGMRWVVTEACIAEFAPRQKQGFFIDMYATMLGLTYVIGPAVLARTGTEGHKSLWIVIALIAIGLVWTTLVPRTEAPNDTPATSIGFQGLKHALTAHPVIMFAGFAGGFFELGLSGILPLVGLMLGMGESSSVRLMAVSGLGGALLGIPAGFLADRFANPARGRYTLMFGLTLALFLSSVLFLTLVKSPMLIWPIVFIWGAAGSTLYTMVMTDIAARDKGVTLVNSTSMLVLSYTLGALIASRAGGALLDHSPRLLFPLALTTLALTCLIAIQQARQHLPR